MWNEHYLQADKHDNIRSAFHRLIRLHARIDQLDQLLEHGRLDHATLVQAAGHVVKVDDSAHIFAELLHQPNVDVRFEQRRANLLQHCIQHLQMHSQRNAKYEISLSHRCNSLAAPIFDRGRESALTSSFITVALLSECKATVIFRPKSAKTIFSACYTRQILRNNTYSLVANQNVAD